MKACLNLFLFLITTTNIVISQVNPIVINFETIETVCIDTTIEDNIWQVGAPQKILFTSSVSPPNSIITDTINYYPTNNKSEFTIKIPTFNSVYGHITMSFFHKMDTDSLCDGGKIELSYDEGLTWENIINTDTEIYESPQLIFYSKLDTVKSLGDVGFSGLSNEWQESVCGWNWPLTETLYIKFVFASDSIENNREGWVIDNVYFKFNLLGNIEESKTSNYVSIHPNPILESAIIIVDDSILDKINLKIVNTDGEIVRVYDDINKSGFTFFKEELPAGIYFGLFSSESIGYVKKIILH